MNKTTNFPRIAVGGGGYSRAESQLIAGIAIIMMFFFHFFAYPDLQPSNNSYFTIFTHLNTPIEQIIAPFGQLCVAIFAFNSGFIYYCKTKIKIPLCNI